MKKNKLKLVLSFFSVIVLLAGCKSTMKDVEPEVVISPDSTFVFAFDYSNKSQVNEFQKFKQNFPDMGLKQMIIDEYNKGVKEDLSYAKAIKPVFENEWKMVMAVEFPKAGESIEDMSVYVVGKFEKDDEAEDLLEKLLEEKYGDGIEEDSEGDFYAWTYEEDDFYMGRYGKLFFLTNSQENRKEAFTRIQNGAGFEVDGVLKGEKILGESNLGYAFIDYDPFMNFFKNTPELEAQMGEMGMMESYLSMIGDTYISFKASADALNLSTVMELKGDENFLKEVYEGKKLQLVDKMPAEGLFFYYEDPSLYRWIESMLFGASSFSTGVTGGMAEPQDYFGGFLKEMGRITGLSVGDLEDLLDSPFAVGLANVDALYPAVYIYLKADEGEEGMLKALNVGVDAFVVDVLDELGKATEDSVFSEDVIAKDIELLNGTGFHKVYVDYSKMPEETMGDFAKMLGSDVAEMKVGLYYGVNGDNTFVMTLHPDFALAYGAEGLAGDANYLEALKKLGLNVGGSMNYIEFTPFMNLLDKYVGMANGFGALPTDVLDKYGKIKAIFESVKFVVSSSVIDGDFMRGEMYLKAEKVKED